MTSEEKVIDLVFHRLSAERFLQTLRQDLPDDYEGVFKEAFLAGAETTLAGYSGNEQELFYKKVCDDVKSADWNRRLPPFHLLFQYGKNVLLYNAGVPVCRFDKALNWRDLFLQVGQDIVVTAWLAHRFVTLGIRPATFSWPAVIPSDNTVISKLLSEGIAENHYHLYGSAAIFGISWARMATYPETILKEREWFGTRLYASMSRGEKDNLLPTKKRSIYAVYIRSLLFRRLHDPDFNVHKVFLQFDRGYYSDEQAMSDLRGEIDVLRMLYGVKFPQPGHRSAVCLDYAFTKDLAGEVMSDHRILAGERFLLFQCFCACYGNAFDTYTQWLFYTYLLLKASWRSELVQTNLQTGFYNFSQYEARKRDLWGMAAYHTEAYRTAINAVLNTNDVTSLELRISPEDDSQSDIGKVLSIDEAKYFHDGEYISRRKTLLGLDGPNEKDPFFYVFHFIKSEDKVRIDPEDPYVPCRHYKQRDQYRQQAIALARALSDHDYLCCRVRGVDACNNETTCRPEVFACVFRFLREFPWEYYRKNAFSVVPPRLSMTYHVGEDFWDIADGLRSIDEAILFLNLKRGDRLGHAIALGVEPVLHYATKSRKIILSKQNLLDDLVWLLFRSAELGVSIPSQLASRLRADADELFHEIYDSALNEEPSLSLMDYYRAWMLRGDDPALYKTGVLQADRFTGCFAFFALNDCGTIKNLASYRSDKRISKLYSYYHYSASVRERGNLVTTASVTNEYVSLMRDMQEAMLKRVNELGISIECNPSSNVLIGTFDNDYQKHPLMRFYDIHAPEEHGSPMAHVSINTDDQGIFGTSLPFEYTLVAAALAARTDENGNRKYTDMHIKEYLRQLQRMGEEQVFPPVK